MSSKDVQPKWWQLYLTFPLLMALFAVDSRLKISIRAHQFVQICIIVIVFGLIHLWLKANTAALSNLDRRSQQDRVHVVHIFSYPAPEHPRTALLHVPDSEVRGLLDDTYELDIIEAKASPVEEVSQE